MAGSKGVKRLKLKRPRSLENQDAISEWNDAQTRYAKRQYTDFTQKQRLVLDDAGQLTGLLTFSPFAPASRLLAGFTVVFPAEGSKRAAPTATLISA